MPHQKTYTGDDLRLLWQGQGDARAHARLKREMYENNWKKQLLLEIEKLFEPDTYLDLKQRVDLSVNVFRWVINELAAVYSRPVHRQIGNNESITPLEDLPAVDMALDLANKWTMAQGEVLVQPIWSDDKMQAVVWPRDMFYALPSPANPLVLDLVVLQHLNLSGSVSHYEVWTTDKMSKYDAQWKRITEDVNPETGEEEELNPDNPFKLVPFSVFHSEYPAGAFWHGDSSDDLRLANLSMGVSLTDYGHKEHFQSYKQMWVKRDGTTDNTIQTLKTDPSAVIEVRGTNASVNVLDMQSNLKEQIGVIFEKSQFTTGLRGARPTLTRGEEGASSGYALKIKEHQKESVWAHQRQLRTMDEQEMWRIARVVFGMTEGAPTIPEGQIIIEWPELGPGANPIELAAYANAVRDAVGEDEYLRLLGYSNDEIENLDREKAERKAREAQPDLQPPTDPGSIL